MGFLLVSRDRDAVNLGRNFYHPIPAPLPGQVTASFYTQLSCRSRPQPFPFPHALPCGRVRHSPRIETIA